MRFKIVISLVMILISLYSSTACGFESEDLDAYQNYIAKYNPRISRKTGYQIAFSVLINSEIFHLDPRLIIALIRQESNFNPTAISAKGAKGLGQLMPGTARMLGVSDPFDIEENVAATCRYLSTQISHWNGYADGLERALASYNAGPNAVTKYDGIPPYKETRNYVKRIKAHFRHLSARPELYISSANDFRNMLETSLVSNSTVGVGPPGNVLE